MSIASPPLLVQFVGAETDLVLPFVDRFGSLLHWFNGTGSSFHGLSPLRDAIGYLGTGLVLARAAFAVLLGRDDCLLEQPFKGGTDAQRKKSPIPFYPLAQEAAA